MVKRRKIRSRTPDEVRVPSNTTNSLGASEQRSSIDIDSDQPTFSERSATGYEAINLFSTSRHSPYEDGSRRTKSNPMELLCRLFPTQKRSVIQLIYKGCNNDFIKTIECVLPSHEKAMASLKYQSAAMTVPRCQQFASPINAFPPFLPFPPNQHHRMYLPTTITSDSLPLYNMHSGTTYKRGYVSSVGLQGKLTREYAGEPGQFSVTQRPCPSCQKDVPSTMRVCDSCGHRFDLAPSPRG